MIESYRNWTLEVNFRILLCNFYVGLDMSHRQLLDCVAKGNFIKIDPSIAHEIIEGIVGTLPQQKGPHHNQEGTQVFEKICEVRKILQKSLEPLKSLSGNLHLSEYKGKHKEPPIFELDSAKKIKTKDDNT